MKKILLILCLSVFAVSCNDDFSVTAEASAPVVPLTVTSTRSGACSFDFTLKAGEGVSDIMYVVRLKTEAVDSIPVSSEIWRGEFANLYTDEEKTQHVQISGVKEISAGSNETVNIPVTNLIPGNTYTFFSITINADGIRSGEVFQQDFTLPLYTTESLNEDFVSGQHVGKPTVNNDSDYPEFTPVVTKVSDYKYTFSTFWGPTFVAEALNNPALAIPAVAYSGTLTINPADFSVTIVGDNSAAWDNPGGKGTYDPCTKTLTYTLDHTLFRLSSTGVLTAGAPGPAGTAVPVTVVMTL